MDLRKKIFAIIGESCSGKDTLVKKVCSEYNYKAVCSYTTRPKRPSEIDGVEHYFVSKEEFDKIKKENEIVAYTKIESNKFNNGFEYMATKKELDKSDIYIIDPIGLQHLKYEYSDDYDIIAIYIFCPYKIRKERSIKRGDNLIDFEKRYNNEKEQFDHFYRHRKFDYVIYSFVKDIMVPYNTLASIMDYELNSRELETEYTSILGSEYKKGELLQCLDYNKTLLDFFKSYFVEDNNTKELAIKHEKTMRNIILSHLR